MAIFRGQGGAGNFDKNATKSEIVAIKEEAVNAATLAQASQAIAEAAAIDAQSSEDDAEASALQAATSETNAANSATSSANSATASSNSAGESATSAQEALQFRNQAEVFKNEASVSESNAATSASNALTSENNAATSESNASTSESNAATSAANALTSENNAATSAANALTSENNAATSESNAATSESNAATSASQAASSAAFATTEADRAEAAAESVDAANLIRKDIPDTFSDLTGNSVTANLIDATRVQANFLTSDSGEIVLTGDTAPEIIFEDASGPNFDSPASIRYRVKTPLSPDTATEIAAIRMKSFRTGNVPENNAGNIQFVLDTPTGTSETTYDFSNKSLTTNDTVYYNSFFEASNFAFAEQHNQEAPFVHRILMEGSRYAPIIKQRVDGTTRDQIFSMGTLHNTDNTQDFVIHRINVDGSNSQLLMRIDQDGTIAVDRVTERRETLFNGRAGAGDIPITGGNWSIYEKLAFYVSSDAGNEIVVNTIHVRDILDCVISDNNRHAVLGPFNTEWIFTCNITSRIDTISEDSIVFRIVGIGRGV